MGQRTGIKRLEFTENPCDLLNTLKLNRFSYRTGECL